MTPKYLLIRKSILDEINSPSRIGLHLPTEREMCSKYNVSRQTIREALSGLESEGIIVKRQGDGIYISEKYFSTRNRVALLLPEEDEYIYPELISKLKEKLLKKGYSLKVFSTKNSISEEIRILQTLLSSNIRGIISIPIMNSMPTGASSLYQKASSLGIPVVFWRGNYSNLPYFPTVTCDDESLSYRLVSSISTPDDIPAGIFFKESPVGQGRFLGFINALTDRLISISDKDILLIDYEALLGMRNDSNVTLVNTFLRNLSAKKIVCHNDEVAYYVMKHLKNQSVEIYSFDDSFLSHLSKGRITSVKVPVETQLNKLLSSVLPG